MSELQTTTPASVLIRVCEQLLEQVGVPEDQAALIAQVTVEADLRGIGSHGVLRLPAYIHRVQNGTMTAQTNFAIIRERGATLLLDAQHGFGQVAGVYAMGQAIERATQFGTSLVAVRNAGHFGIAAYYTMLALSENMIGVVSANAAPSMAAWGGTTPMLGTNPISVAIPTGQPVDIVLDMASSVVARGKIRFAASQEQPIPLGWALDADGQPTEDPHAAIKGTLLPIGGPKGYGLALIVDILSGVLTGAAYGPNIVSLHDLTQDVAGGFSLQAIDISAFMDLDEFERRLQDFITDIRRSHKAPGVERIYLPGEIEYNTKQERLENGIPVPENLLQILDQLADELGVALDWTTVR
jgi:LDH2 family malate/lactate/ureidoglycolate dehydrogenase